MPTVRLPVVRVRPLPPSGEPLLWREGPDWPAAVAVLTVAGLGLVLAVATVMSALPAARDGVVPIAGAVALGAVCAAALVAAAGECLHRERILVRGKEVRVERRGFPRGGAFREPLTGYAGLQCQDRRRRFFVRNQDNPPSGRRGPVTEFVVVLRHATDRTRDLELFRAQPSLETLSAMHAMSGTAVAGSRRALAADACLQRAGSYRDALQTLARQLRKPALVPAPDGGLDAVDPRRLDSWLDPGAAARDPRQLPA